MNTNITKSQQNVNIQMAHQLLDQLKTHHADLIKNSRDIMTRQANDIAIKLDHLLSDAYVDIQTHWDERKIEKSLTEPESIYTDEMPAYMAECQSKVEELVEFYVDEVINIGNNLIDKRHLELLDCEKGIDISNVIQELNVDHFKLNDEATILYKDFMSETALIVRKFDDYIGQILTDVADQSK